jgi:hypothetical protein
MEDSKAKSPTRFTSGFLQSSNGDGNKDRPGYVFPTMWRRVLILKEVIHPHLPVRVPCYDLVPLTPLTFDRSLLTVGPRASGENNSGDLTGGVYKTRERIQRSIADLRLLAIPPSCSRVADCNLN